MIAQIFVDGRLLYDSRLPEESGYLLEKAEIQETLNKGGTATIVVPRIHPLHGSCRAYSVPVEIYKDGRLRWRGRPLPPSSNFYLQDQIVCEGEFCFLNDAVIRPFSCVSPPGDIFRDVIAKYNASMTDEPWKQFAVGRITVSGGEIPFNIEAPEKARATVERLIELCGGYVLFDSAPDGRRQINYLSSLPYICNQRIQFGSNLTDYASTYDNPNFSTRLIPYGAMGEDKTRLKINIDGRDFVENTAARQTFGVIEASAVYDGITSAQELQAQAERDVAAMSTLPQIVELGAVDLSRQDATLDAFCIGQVVPCYSVPHGMDGTYALLSLQEDLINPGVGKVALSYEAGAFSQPSAGRTFSQKVASGLKKNSSAAKKTSEEVARSQVEIQEHLQALRKSIMKDLAETTWPDWKKDLLDELNQDVWPVWKAEAVLAAHPVGSGYIAFDGVIPGELFGGQWEQVAWADGPGENITLWRRIA